MRGMMMKTSCTHGITQSQTAGMIASGINLVSLMIYSKNLTTSHGRYVYMTLFISNPANFRFIQNAGDYLYNNFPSIRKRVWKVISQFELGVWTGQNLWWQPPEAREDWWRVVARLLPFCPSYYHHYRAVTSRWYDTHLVKISYNSIPSVTRSYCRMTIHASVDHPDNHLGSSWTYWRAQSSMFSHASTSKWIYSVNQ